MEFLDYGKNERLLTLPNETFNLLVAWMENTGFVKRGELKPGNINKTEKERIRLFLTAVVARFGSLPLDGPLGIQQLPINTGGSSNLFGDITPNNTFDDPPDLSVPDDMFE